MVGVRGRNLQYVTLSAPFIQSNNYWGFPTQLVVVSSSQ